ncbi:MAG: hypothetical protein ACRBDL_05795 [Alphaproteobacteria bacterium]
MTDITDTKTTKDMLDQGHNFALIGLIMSLFAFSLAVFTPWINENFAPPEPVLEEVSVEKAGSIYDSIFSFDFIFAEDANVEGADATDVQATEDVESSTQEAPMHWTDYWPVVVITIALIGIIQGAFGLLRKDQRYIATTAICFGMAAIVASYIWIALAVFVFIILITVVLVSMGVSF